MRGRETNTHKIYRWRLEASTDGENFLTLFSAPNPTYLGNEVTDYIFQSRCFQKIDQSMMAVSRVVEFDDLTEKSLVNSLKRVLFQV